MKRLIFALVAVLVRSAFASEERVSIVGYEVGLAESDCLYRFDTFESNDWTIVKHTPKWTVGRTEIVGGGPDEPRHGQIFYKTPVTGDVVMEFDARLIGPSDHDLVWFWGTEFDREPWSAGHLASLGGWWDNLAGIETLPNYEPSVLADSFPIEANRTYHIVSGTVCGNHFVIVDGKLVAQLVEPSWTGDRTGYFGFGVYHSHAAYSRLRVYRPKAEKVRKSYAPSTGNPLPKDGADYLAIDLRGGRAATNFPVRATMTPPDFSAEATRGDELWLRKFAPNRYIGVFEVTQGQWEKLTGTNPSKFRGCDRPVETVAYDAIVEKGGLLDRLSERTKLTVRLPTIAEWQQACRAGTTTAYSNGSDSTNIAEIARYESNTNDCRGAYGEHARVGSYLPNPIGLYDMHGNVWEWTTDVIDGVRSRCGGSWAFRPERCRSDSVGKDAPEKGYNDLGFRIVVETK